MDTPEDEIRERSPLGIVLFHGPAGDETELVPLARRVAPGAALLPLRGTVEERGLRRFFRPVRRGVINENELRQRASDVAAAIDRFLEVHNVERRDAAVIGYSSGADMAAALLLLEPGIVTHAVLFRPMLPLSLERAPDMRGARVLVVGGSHDPVATPPDVESLAHLLEEYGAAVRLEWLNCGHALTAADAATARAWFSAGSTPTARDRR